MVPYEAARLDYLTTIDTIDIDPAVYEIAQEHFLEEEFDEKIVFSPESARYFVNQAIADGTTYDFILVDAYNGRTLPDELATREFFEGLREIVSEDGLIVFNFILDTHYESDLARNILATVDSVMGDVWAQNVTKNVDYPFDNILVSTQQLDENWKDVESDGEIYTDNQRTTETDIVKMFWSE